MREAVTDLKAQLRSIDRVEGFIGGGRIIEDEYLQQELHDYNIY